MEKNAYNKNINSAEGVFKKKYDTVFRGAQTEIELAKGYEEMSRINLNLSDSALEADNEALALCEQKLAECE